MTMKEVFVNSKSCKTNKNTVKTPKMYALHHISFTGGLNSAGCQLVVF